MKAILPYIILFIVTTLMTGLVVGGIAMFRPDLLFPPAPAEASGAPYGPTLAELIGTDSTGTAHDSTAANPDSSAVGAGELAAGPEHRGADSTHTLSDTSHAAPALAADTAVVDSIRAKEKASLAKVFDSMPPESAARILAGVSDEDVRHIILTLKKRQAAKILAALAPERAARLMR